MINNCLHINSLSLQNKMPLSLVLSDISNIHIKQTNMNTTTKVQKEIWKDIPGHENYYQVSNFGGIRRLPKTITFVRNGYINTRKLELNYLSPTLFNNGYLFVSIKGKKYTVHSLVAMAFLNHIMGGWNIVIDHIDENKTNNNIKNLRLISHRENVARGYKNTSSKYVGVFLDGKKWRSVIIFKNKRIYLGSFNSEKEASEYYQNALIAIENDTKIKVKKPKYSSKYNGVLRTKYNKWVAKIYIKQSQKYLGTFNTEIEAHNAYQKAKKESTV